MNPADLIKPAARRALRRHHRERLKRQRRRHWERDLAGNPAEWGAAVRTPCPCSCPMCGNPRRWFGEITMQERRAAVDSL